MTALIFSILTGGSMALGCLSLYYILSAIGVRRRLYYAERLDKLQRFDESPAQYMLMEWISAFIGAALLYFLFDAVLFGIIGGILGFLVPCDLMRRHMYARHDKLVQQLPDALLSMSSSIRAGLALSQAIEQVGDEFPAPVGQEFQLLARQNKAGVPLDDGLRSMQRRLNSRHVTLVCNALTINREHGGDITVILERIASSLRELYRLEEKIKVETAGARFQAQAMIFVPPLVLFMLSTVQPELVQKMFRSPIGIVMVLIAVTLMVVAYLWIQKILREDI